MALRRPGLLQRRQNLRQRLHRYEKLGKSDRLLVSLLLIIGGTAFAVYAVLVLARSISIMPEAKAE